MILAAAHAGTMVLAIANASVSAKKSSITVTAEMRENAVRNVERHPWAKKRKDELLARVRPYMEATDEALWRLLPSQGMPRSSPVERDNSPPPSSEKSHFDKPPDKGYGWHSSYHIDPFRHPWKIQNIGSGLWYPYNDFAAYYESSLDEKGNFHLDRGNPEFLKPTEDFDGKPLVDDGRGVKVGDRKFFFAAHYAFRIWVELIDVAHSFAELYTLTNDPIYAHKAAVLLDRMADLYPAMTFRPWFDLGMEASTGGEGIGRVQGKIWETWTAQKLSLAYDMIFDALAQDETLAAFSQNIAEKYHLEDKGSGRKIAAHIENNLLREFVRGIRDGRIGGNPGMHQLSMAAAAIALDNGEETRQMLDWLFTPDGGQLPFILVDGLSRDGFGLEGGLGYASIPAKSLFQVARLLMRYPDYPRKNLFEEFPKFANSLSAGERVRVAGGSILHWGDGGKAMMIGSHGYPMPADMALMGFQTYGRPDNVRELFNAMQGDSDKIPGDIYAREPEKQQKAAVRAIRESDTDTLVSFNSGGIGFAVLQAPDTQNKRMVALNYGPMGWTHGQSDRLGLHLISHGAYMATDLGYPTLTGPYPPRIGWTSHTASHNTVMVDDHLMERESTFSGKTKLFSEAGSVRIMDVEAAGDSVLRGMGHSSKFGEARPIYPGVETYRRCIIMVDVDTSNSYYVDLFWIRGGSIHRLIQNGGGAEVTSNWKPWFPQSEGTVAGENIPYGKFYDGPASWDYRGSGLMFLNRVERAKPDRPFWVDWKIASPFNLGKDLRFRVHNLAPIHEAILADGETPSRGPTLRYLHRTVRGDNLYTQFVTILEPYEKEPLIDSCRLLGTKDGQKEFAAALEITLKDGRKDLLLVTEKGGKFSVKTATPENFFWRLFHPSRGTFATLEGRAAWARYNASGNVEASALIEASAFKVNGSKFEMKPASYAGIITAIDDTDSENVILKTDNEDLPEMLRDKYVIIDNHQRADASYRIKAVNGGEINIGNAALEEMHVNPNDYSEGTIRNIAVGESFFIANDKNFSKGSE